LDIYGTAENMEQAFIDFSKKVKPGGLLISKYGLNRAADLGADQMLTYHLTDNKANVFASNIIIQNGSYQFDIELNDSNGGNWMLKGVVLNMGGKHNIENMLAAITVAHHIGVEDKKIIDAVADFKGVKRRFEYILKSSHQVFIDDYAHHPTEIAACLNSVKALYPGVKITAVFQPHLFSRTRDFMEDFAKSLAIADELYLLDIYPARELPIEGVTSDWLLNKIELKEKQVISKKDLLRVIDEKKPALLVTMGAGDIDLLLNDLKLSLS
jgi:UDP-N-acetylmuramate--alanine ligase